MAAMEYTKKNGQDAFDAIETRIKTNTSSSSKNPGTKKYFRDRLFSDSIAA